MLPHVASQCVSWLFRNMEMLFSFISLHTFSLSHFQPKNNISKYFIHYVIAYERMQYLTFSLKQENQDLLEERGWAPDLTMRRANSCWYYRGSQHQCVYCVPPRTLLWPICPDISLIWGQPVHLSH